MRIPSWIESCRFTVSSPTGTRSAQGAAARSRATGRLTPRVASAAKVVKSICPYCAVGCGQNVYVEKDKVTQIEGDPDSPISRGRLCPKGSASLQLTTATTPSTPLCRSDNGFVCQRRFRALATCLPVEPTSPRADP